MSLQPFELEVGGTRVAGLRNSGDGPRVLASELDRRLRVERLRPGRGFSRAGDRLVWPADVATGWVSRITAA